jgi:hypothetical protein
MREVLEKIHEAMKITAVIRSFNSRKNFGDGLNSKSSQYINARLFNIA